MKTIYSEKNQKLISILRDLRVVAGITQTALSEKLGKPQSYVSKYENGERRLDVVEFLEVCRMMKIDPHSVIDTLIKQ